MNFVLENWPLFLALVVIIVLLIRTWVGPGAVQRRLPTEVVRMINHDDAVLVDVRTDKEYQQGHILDALHIPVGLLENRIAELQPYKDRPIVFVCRTGARSSVAAYKAKKQGFEHVHNLGGGMMAWESANLPVTTGPSTRKPAADSAGQPGLEGPEVEPGASADRHDVLIYTTALCPYCTRAVKLLKSKGVDFTEVRVDIHPDRRVEMESRAGSSSVPQIFIGDHHVGGCDELYALEADDELGPLLERATAEETAAEAQQGQRNGRQNQEKETS